MCVLISSHFVVFSLLVFGFCAECTQKSHKIYDSPECWEQFFLFQSVVVTGNARIRLAFSTEFQIHIIITLHTLNEVDVDTGPTRWIQAPKSIFVVRIERVCRALLSHRGRSSPLSRVAQHIRVFACERVSPFRPHNSTIVKMTPMLSSAIFDFRMQLANIFIRRVVHERRTHSPNGRYTREPSARPAVESVCIDHDFMTDYTDAIRFRYIQDLAIQYVAVVGTLTIFWLLCSFHSTDFVVHGKNTPKNRFIRWAWIRP